ncbi:hypothetical protein [Actinacidiphila oryziradicis]|jgi:hypothetical protein|nr:hypothetical protein [Actinacidiphila oryziradicis]
MLRTVHGTAVAPNPIDAQRRDAAGALLTQRRVVDFGLVNSACCR